MKLKQVKRLPTTAVRFQDADGEFTPKAFPALDGDEMMNLQGVVQNNLKDGRQPSTQQLRIIAKLMKMRLAKGKPSKEGGMRYHQTPWGLAQSGIESDNLGTKSITAKSSPHM